MALNPRQARFVAEYLKDPNGTQAYIRAGYVSAHPSDVSKRLRRKPHVRAAIGAGQRKILRKLDLTVKRLIAAHARMAFANLDDYLEIREDGSARIDLSKAGAGWSVARITVSRLRTPRGGRTHGRRLRITLTSKLRALDALARHLGMFAKR